MSIERFEAGSILFQSGPSDIRIPIAGNLTGLTVLNNIVPVGTKVSLDDSAFEFEIFPYQTIEIPQEFKIRNSITIKRPSSGTLTLGNTSIQTDLPFKILAFFGQKPSPVPLIKNIDVFKIRNDGGGQSALFNLNFQSAIVFASTPTAADLQSFKYLVGHSDSGISGDEGYFMLRGDAETNQKTLHFDFPFNDLRLIPLTAAKDTDFFFIISSG